MYLCDMVTYIIESSGYIKIGKAEDLKRRLCDYDLHNPCYKVIFVIDGDCEKYLHKVFSSKRVRSEWFSLSDSDINWIKSNEKDLIDKENSNRNAEGIYTGEQNEFFDNRSRSEYLRNTAKEKRRLEKQ